MIYTQKPTERSLCKTMLARGVVLKRVENKTSAMDVGLKK